MQKNYYQILGLAPNCTKTDIKKAYKLYATKFHPDKHSDDKFFEEKFKEIKEAYDILIDDDARKKFDTSYDVANDFDKEQDNTDYEQKAKSEGNLTEREKIIKAHKQEAERRIKKAIKQALAELIICQQQREEFESRKQSAYYYVDGNYSKVSGYGRDYQMKFNNDNEGWFVEKEYISKWEKCKDVVHWECEKEQLAPSPTITLSHIFPKQVKIVERNEILKLINKTEDDFFRIFIEECYSISNYTKAIVKKSNGTGIKRYNKFANYPFSNWTFVLIFFILPIIIGTVLGSSLISGLLLSVFIIILSILLVMIFATIPLREYSIVLIDKQGEEVELGSIGTRRLRQMEKFAKAINTAINEHNINNKKLIK
ncbi:hypothetical protein FACS1894156_8420 [Bacteroidia bacterium]|nr:hypothetical protein FACS1894156_8420 [Bacteroidia bacterium]